MSPPWFWQFMKSDCMTTWTIIDPSIDPNRAEKKNWHQLELIESSNNETIAEDTVCGGYETRAPCPTQYETFCPHSPLLIHIRHNMNRWCISVQCTVCSVTVYVKMYKEKCCSILIFKPRLSQYLIKKKMIIERCAVCTYTLTHSHSVGRGNSLEICERGERRTHVAHQFSICVSTIHNPVVRQPRPVASKTRVCLINRPTEIEKLFWNIKRK